MKIRIPTKQKNEAGGELVQDTAKVFPKEMIPQIEKAAKEGPYTFHVLTIDSLDWTNSTVYAARAYTEWKLGANDVLMLISKENPLEIQMSFENTVLLEKFNALPDDIVDTYNMTSSKKRYLKILKFIGAHATREAEKGNFTKGVMELMKATNALKSASVAPAILNKINKETRENENKPAVNESIPSKSEKGEHSNTKPDASTREHVQDTAKMFPKEIIPQIEKAAKGEPYTFYVLTVNSLDGKEPSDYATKVYNEWKLGADDILLLISKQERRVEMNFNNAVLQEKLNALPDDMNADGTTNSKLSEFVDTHFIPEAKKGDFVKASMELMKATNALKLVPAASVISDETNKEAESDENKPTVNEPVPSKPEKGEEKNETPKNTSPLNQPINQQETLPVPSTPINWGWVSIAGIGLLVLVLLAELAFRLLRLRGLRVRLPQLMVQVDQAAERIKSYVELSQGKTLKTATSIDKELTNMLLQMNELKQELSLIQAKHWMIPSLRKQLKAAVDVLAKITEHTAQLVTQITHIEEIDRTLSQILSDIESHLNEIGVSITKEQTHRGWSLEGLVKRQETIQSELEESKQIGTFDPLGAEHIVNHANQELLQLEQDISSIDSYADMYRDFPNEMTACRQQFEQIVQEHRLKLVRIKPYENVEQAREINEQMYKHLQNGDMVAVIQHVERMRQLLREAVQMTQRQADLKEKNASDIDLVTAKLAAYPEQDAELAVVTENVRQLYRTKHWEEVWYDYRDRLPCTEDAAESLRQIQQWCDEDVQEYELAREKLDQILHTLRELDGSMEQYEQLVRELDNLLDETKRKQTAAEAACVKGEDIISRNQLVQQWGRQIESLNRLQSGLQQLFTEPPYDMELISEISQQFVEEAEQFLGEVERAAIQKRKAEREIRKAEGRYHSAYSRASRKINVKGYSYKYASINAEVKQLMRRGEYEQAARTAATLAGITEAMNQAYDAVVQEERRQERIRREEERRRREERQRQEQQRSNNNSSGGSSWGGSNSSGGSSWGDSSNSSGGSSWDSNKNNSSGGSNW
ncbi:TPM domain-containing protein [Aneurinibacillus aneurinilyticus]|uniref:TPM domain-containing protein n=1 Tax=Aneurinibacillus aneurinilyticus TaxID=1391 RepID=UPI002E2335A7|nr:TPM domain-containing protein [Aneurinibacillus aneurinilyticus]